VEPAARQALAEQMPCADGCHHCFGHSIKLYVRVNDCQCVRLKRIPRPLLSTRRATKCATLHAAMRPTCCRDGQEEASLGSRRHNNGCVLHVALKQLKVVGRRYGVTREVVYLLFFKRRS
jgi:hypothetical protein